MGFAGSSEGVTLRGYLGARKSVVAVAGRQQDSHRSRLRRVLLHVRYAPTENASIRLAARLEAAAGQRGARGRSGHGDAGGFLIGVATPSCHASFVFSKNSDIQSHTSFIAIQIGRASCR